MDWRHLVYLCWITGSTKTRLVCMHHKEPPLLAGEASSKAALFVRPWIKAFIIENGTLQWFMIRDKCFQQNPSTMLHQTSWISSRSSDLRLDAAYLMSEPWPEPARIGWTSYGCRVTVVGHRECLLDTSQLHEMSNTGSIMWWVRSQNRWEPQKLLLLISCASSSLHTQ